MDVEEQINKPRCQSGVCKEAAQKFMMSCFEKAFILLQKSCSRSHVVMSAVQSFSLSFFVDAKMILVIVFIDI